MKPKRGPVASLLKGFERAFRSLRQHFKDRRQRRGILRAYRQLDRRSWAERGRGLPRPSFLVLAGDEPSGGGAALARCLDSLRGQRLPVAGVHPVVGPPLESLAAVLATTGPGPVAVTLPSGTFYDDATLWLGLAIARSPGWKAVYADHAAAPAAGGPRRQRPHIKPDFSWLYLLARHFVEPFVVYDRDTLDAAVGRLRAAGAAPRSAAEAAYAVALEALQDLDARQVIHVREPLTVLDPAAAVGLGGVVEEALARRGVAARVRPHPADPALNQLTLPRPAAPAVTIVIPTKNASSLVTGCIDSLRANAGSVRAEIVVIDHDSDEPELAAYLARETAAGRLSVFPWSGPFNYAAMNNAAVRRAALPLVLLLNNDIDGFSPGWLDQLVATIELDPAIAAVGCLLTYPDGAIQHAGVVFTPRRPGFHGHAGLPHDALGYQGRIRSLQEYSAVTAAMMLVRREAFLAVGGFDEQFPNDYNDVDLCLRLRAAGYRIAYTPHASAVHWESRTRTAKWTGKDAFEARWGGFFGRDPFYSPYFQLKAFAPDAAERLWRERKAVALQAALEDLPPVGPRRDPEA